MKYEVTIKKNPPYSGWWWDVEPSHGRGGIAFTLWGAKFAVKRKIWKYERSLTKPVIKYQVETKSEDPRTLAYELNILAGIQLAKDKEEVYVGDAYCVYCKDKTEFTGKIRVSDSGRRMATGKCPRCGQKVNRILGKATD